MAKTGPKSSKSTSKEVKGQGVKGKDKRKTRADDHQNLGEKPTPGHRYQEYSIPHVYTKAGIYKKPILEAEFQSTRYLRTGTDFEDYQ
jgi:hypothetical protein